MHLIDLLAPLQRYTNRRSVTVFPDGWGNDPSWGARNESSDPPLLDIVWGRKEEHQGFRRIKGTFASPFAAHLPLPARAATVELVEPSLGGTTTVILLPAWNDEGFTRRRPLASRLASAGLSVASLEIPFYGSRRTVDGNTQPVRTVTDFLSMSQATVREVVALIRVLKARGPVGVAGFSMGGSLAAQAIAHSPVPVFGAAASAAASPARTYTDGTLSRLVSWSALGGDGRDRLRELLDEVSLLHRPPPEWSNDVVFLAAERDHFVDSTETRMLADHWGAEYRTVPGGHATVAWRHQDSIADAILAASTKIDTGVGQ